METADMAAKLRALEYRPIRDEGEARPGFVAEVERAVEVPLPSEYLAFLRAFPRSGAPDGFVTVRGIEPIPFVPDGMFMWDALYADDAGGSYDLLENFVELRERAGGGWLPVGADPGGNLFLMRLVGPDAGKIWFWDRDYDFGDGEGTARVANSFAEMVMNSELQED
jgi:hypothetical protein